MNAVDTNIIVRYLTADHAEQSEKARRLIDDQSAFVATTVVLETEWVLKSGYGLSKSERHRVLTTLAHVPTFVLEEPIRVRDALHGMADGLDFADALHLAAAAGCEAFYTFDRDLAKRATRADAVAVRMP